ncbi:MAG: hypothetical protein IT385_27135 [Deltaproteobacteria bacterium]|nr:hypothetical protein [Deltaproteobacteria bacterium]
MIEVGPFDDYKQGQECVVDFVDPSDGTLRGRDVQTGRVGGWLRWSQVAPIADAIGMEFLEQHLSPETLTLLRAFDGLEALRLKPEIRDRILLALPDLEERVREVATERRRPGPRLRRRKQARRAEARAIAPAAVGEGEGRDGGLEFDEVEDEGAEAAR